MEDMLREDAAEAAEIIEADIADDATDGSSYSSEQEANYAVYDGSYDIDAPRTQWMTNTVPAWKSHHIKNEDGECSSFASFFLMLLKQLRTDTYDVDGEEEIDKSLLEAVILRLAEGEMKQKLEEEEEEEEAEAEESEMDEYEDVSSSYGNILEGDRDTG
ncbi:hypothetical protein BSL78_03525 [Apostichopus japonicus]|uniref:Uncharacterized protein n=1 Tax=Stichopus japonicus TaxID=307972 RepID=A0A2G8LH12_STIJA|nr:hypothetical protein BSL78_03525 [Apostichopus japonicus]